MIAIVPPVAPCYCTFQDIRQSLNKKAYDVCCYLGLTSLCPSPENLSNKDLRACIDDLRTKAQAALDKDPVGDGVETWFALRYEADKLSQTLSGRTISTDLYTPQKNPE